MHASIVNRLRSWIKDHADGLRRQGILVEERVPDEHSPAPWKASVGFTFESIVACYTVWERAVLQTELIVVNSKTRQTLLTKDSKPPGPEAVDSDLSELVQKLYNREYERMPALQTYRGQ